MHASRLDRVRLGGDSPRSVRRPVPFDVCLLASPLPPLQELELWLTHGELAETMPRCWETAEKDRMRPPAPESALRLSTDGSFGVAWGPLERLRSIYSVAENGIKKQSSGSVASRRQETRRSKERLCGIYLSDLFHSK